MDSLPPHRPDSRRVRCPWALWRRSLGATLLAGVVLAAAPNPMRAQERPDSIAAEVARLSALVDSLAREVERMRSSEPEADPGDALARLRAAADSAAAAGAGGSTPSAPSESREFVGRQRSLQALNPEISVLGDVIVQPVQQNIREDRAFPREFEFSFVSNLDPFSRAKIFASNHTGGAEIVPFGEEEEEEGGMAIEEGYLEWVGLPGGLSLRLGKFFQQFGQLNRWHSHALPFQSRSLPHLSFVGHEQLAQTGASVHWLLPIGGRLGTYEATVEVTNSSSEQLFGESTGVSTLGHLNGFWTISRATDLNVGVSWIDGALETADYAGDRDLYGAEVAFTWRPPDRALYRGVTVRGGVMVLDGLTSDGSPLPGAEPLPLLDERAVGVWTATEVRLGRQWLAGARLDHSENPKDTDESAWLLSPTLTWWQSEFVRVRAEYDLLGRSVQSAHEGRFLLQVTFAMGPHKHENY